MSRVYGDESGDVLHYGRWERNTKATLESKRGQKALKEIESALLALPEKRLAYHDLHTKEDGVDTYCVLGALARHKGISTEVLDEVSDDDGQDQVHWAVDELGLRFTLAWNLMYDNDLNPGESEENRYERMLRFVQRHISKEVSDGVDSGNSGGGSHIPTP